MLFPRERFSVSPDARPAKNPGQFAVIPLYQNPEHNAPHVYRWMLDVKVWMCWVCREKGKKEIVAGRRLDEIGHIHGHLLDLGAVKLLNLAHHAHVLGGDEVDRNTLAAETTTTTDAMDVVLAVSGKIVVDDQGNLLDIDTTGQKIGGDENAG